MGIKTSHLGFVWEREHSTYIMSHHGFSFLSKVGTTHSTPRALTPLLLWASLCSQQPFRVYLGEGGLRIRHLQNQPFRVLGGDSTYIMISAFFQSLERLIPLQGLLLISCFGHPYAHSSHLGFIWGRGFRMGGLVGFQKKPFRVYLGVNILLTSSCQLSVKVWTDSAHSKGSYSSFALGILPGITSAKRRPTGKKRTASEVPAQLRARKQAARQDKTTDKGEKQANPQKTHKEAGQQKPELPPPSR